MGSYLKEAQILREAMDVAMKILTDEQALHAVAIYPLWRSDGEYQKDDRVRYGDVLYKCLTPHTAQPSWTPTDAPSLWAKVLTSETGEPLPWEQPESTNPYMQGDRVTHGGKTWVSTMDNNVWEPGVYGWEETDG